MIAIARSEHNVSNVQRKSTERKYIHVITAETSGIGRLESDSDTRVSKGGLYRGTGKYGTFQANFQENSRVPEYTGYGIQDMNIQDTIGTGHLLNGEASATVGEDGGGFVGVGGTHTVGTGHLLHGDASATAGESGQIVGNSGYENHGGVGGFVGGRGTTNMGKNIRVPGGTIGGGGQMGGYGGVNVNERIANKENRKYGLRKSFNLGFGIGGHFGPFSFGTERNASFDFGKKAEKITNENKIHVLKLLFQHIKLPEYPAEIITASQNINKYLSSVPFNLQLINANIYDQQNLGPDLLVTFLLKIQREIPIECSVRNDLSFVLLYNMLKSFNVYIPVLRNSFPNIIDAGQLTGPSDLQYGNIIKDLSLKLHACESKSINSCPVAITHDSPYKNLTLILPPGNNTYEVTKYKLIVNLLNRPDIESVLGPIDLSTAKNDPERLYLILKHVSKLNAHLDAGTLNAINFYLTHAEKLGPLHWVTGMHIEKEFNVKQIITDTINFETLPNEEKLAFDTFYDFLFGVTNDKLQSFNWLNIKTKGEFTQMLFTYFLEQSFTSPEVKKAIQILKPYINMDGLGATPL